MQPTPDLFAVRPETLALSRPSGHNPTMIHARVLIGLLFVATVLVDSAVWRALLWATQHGKPDVSVLMMTASSLPFSQVGLVALWTGLGRTAAPWRVLGVVLTAACWSWLVAVLFASDPPPFTRRFLEFATPWTFFLLLEAAAIAAPLSVARLIGFSLASAADLECGRRDLERPRRFQFSLRSLFAWMTATAIALGATGYTFHLRHFGIVEGSLLQMLMMAVGNAAMAMAGLWVMLHPEWRWRRVILFGAVVLVAVALATPNLGWRFAAMLSCPQAIWLLGSLWVVRVAGYRVVWQPRTPDGR